MMTANTAKDSTKGLGGSRLCFVLAEIGLRHNGLLSERSLNHFEAWQTADAVDIYHMPA
jgi:hypothetical protein